MPNQSEINQQIKNIKGVKETTLIETTNTGAAVGRPQPRTDHYEIEVMFHKNATEKTYRRIREIIQKTDWVIESDDYDTSQEPPTWLLISPEYTYKEL